MKLMIHQKLHSKLETYAHTTGLSDLEYKGIRLEWGFSRSLTATDAVLAITALLESHATRPSAKLTVKSAFWCGRLRLEALESQDDKIWRK